LDIIPQVINVLDLTDEGIVEKKNWLAFLTEFEEK
jgi:hypothetical protein